MFKPIKPFKPFKWNSQRIEHFEQLERFEQLTAMPYSTANSIKIYYEISGEGFPFVMIHANPFDHNLWMHQVAHFSTYFKVIARYSGLRTFRQTDDTVQPQRDG